MRSIGYFASSGSSVLVPSIVGLSTGAASSALSAVGLVLGSSTGSTSSGASSENNGNIASQSIAAGTYVDYGTTITYTTYAYSPPSYPPSGLDASLPGLGVVGIPYSDGVSATNMQYNGSYSVISGSLPAGISLNSATGAVTGTPTTAAAYNFTIRATNSYGSLDMSFSGFISNGSALSLGVYFDTPSSNTQLTGYIFAENTSGANRAIVLTTSAGSISPTSYVSQSETSTTTPFTVTGLSAGQTVTVTASNSTLGASASQSATTTGSSGGGGSGGGTITYTHSFTYGLGTQTVPSGSEFVNSGSVYTPSSQNLTVNTGAPLGNQTFFAFTSGTWNWLVYRTPS